MGTTGQLGSNESLLGTMQLGAAAAEVVPPPAAVASTLDKVTLGTKEAHGVTLSPTLGGWLGH